MHLTLHLQPRFDVTPDLRTPADAYADAVRAYEPGYQRAPRTAAYALRFAWDSDTGAVTGPDAETVQAIVDAYGGHSVPHRQQPGDWPVNDPLHDPMEMAALLGYWWHLPPELEAVYPYIPDNTPQGAVN